MKKRITETSLLDGFDSVTAWLDLVSIVDEKIIYWSYRKTDGIFQTACVPSAADHLTIEHTDGGYGTKRLPLCKKNRNREILAKIEGMMHA